MLWYIIVALAKFQGKKTQNCDFDSLSCLHFLELHLKAIDLIMKPPDLLVLFCKVLVLLLDAHLANPEAHSG